MYSSIVYDRKKTKRKHCMNCKKVLITKKRKHPFSRKCLHSALLLSFFNIKSSTFLRLIVCISCLKKCTVSNIRIHMDEMCLYIYYVIVKNVPKKNGEQFLLSLSLICSVRLYSGFGFAHVYTSNLPLKILR